MTIKKEMHMMVVLTVALYKMDSNAIKIVITLQLVLMQLKLFYQLTQLFKVKLITHLLWEWVFGHLCMSFVLLMSNQSSASTMPTSLSTVFSSIMQQVSSYSKLTSHPLVGIATWKCSLFLILQLIIDILPVLIHKQV